MAGVGVVLAGGVSGMMVGSASAWTVNNLTASCGQLDAKVPYAGTYTYSVGSTIKGTFTTTYAYENVTVGGIYANGLTTITMMHGSQVAAKVKWLFVNCAGPPQGPTGPTGATGVGATGPTGPSGPQGARDRSNGTRWNDGRNGTDRVTGHDRRDRAGPALRELCRQWDRRKAHDSVLRLQRADRQRGRENMPP